jgi:hypothetical protein
LNCEQATVEKGQDLETLEAVEKSDGAQAAQQYHEKRIILRSIITSITSF